MRTSVVFEIEAEADPVTYGTEAEGITGTEALESEALAWELAAGDAELVDSTG